MLKNGLCLVVRMAVRAAADPEAERWTPALLLGTLREDVIQVPFLGLIEYPSFSHFYRPGLPGGAIPFLWPGPRLCADRLFRRALREEARGRSAAAWLALGRILHLLADMSIPSHVHRVAHGFDPFEWHVEGNGPALERLPVSEIAAAGRPSELVESLARIAMAHEPDRTNNPVGRLLRKAGRRRNVPARVAASQAKELIPIAAGHGAALLRMFLRDARAQRQAPRRIA